MIFQDSKGIRKTVIIPDTNARHKENISKYTHVWFEFASTDNEYNIKLVIT